MTVDEQIEKDIEESLNQKMTDMDIGKPLSFRRPPVEGTQLVDYDKLMDIGSRLLKQKVDEHLSATSSYEHKRTELVDSYRVRMERLKIEAEEQLRFLDQQHADKMLSLEKLINKLKMLRET